MKLRTNVAAHEKAIVFKNNRFVKLLGEGKHWLMPGETAISYDMTQPFITDLNMNILLQEPAMAKALLVIEVKEAELVLLYENKIFKSVLTMGRYYFWEGVISYTIKSIDISNYTNAEAIYRLVQTIPALAPFASVLHVEPYELALLYENDVFKAVLPTGKYILWNGVLRYTTQIINISNYEIDESTYHLIQARPELIPFTRLVQVESYEKALLFENSVFKRELASGIHYFWKNAVSLTTYKSDTRQLQMEMNGQEILTKDKVNIRLNFSFMYRVIDIYKAVASKEYDKQLYVVMQQALREEIGIYSLDELLDKRNAISPSVLAAVAERAGNLGVEILECGIRDIILPGDMKDIMNQVLMAEKKAQANSIMRREETASTRSLLNTAKLMEENEMLFKLKQMEYVEKIADRINNITVSGGGDIVGQLKQLFVP